MVKRLLILLAVLWVTLPTLAQSAPDPINAALADLSNRVNRTVSLSQVSEWNYQQSVYPSPALGCPQPGVAYADVLTGGFQFIITYNGTVYDYRVSDDKSIVILCGTAPAPATVPPCPPPNDAAFLAPRLSKGIQARVVSGGLPNVIREQPGSSSKLLGQIPPNDTLIVIDGPRCTLLDKIVWWQINYNNLIGWTGEGQDGTYWLEPAEINLTPTAPESGSSADQLTSIVTTSGPLVVSADSNLYAWVKDDSVVVSDISSQNQVTSFDGNAVKITQLAFSFTGEILAAGTETGEIRLFDMTAKPTVRTPFRALSGHTGAITAIAFSPDGSLLASSGADKTLRIWDLASGNTPTTLMLTSNVVNAVAFTANGKYLITHSQDGTNTIYPVKSEAAG